MTIDGPTTAGTADPEELGNLAREAMRSGREEDALPTLRAAAERNKDALLWSWTARLEQSLDEHERALACYTEALRIAPDLFRVVHYNAQCRLEAGLPAVAEFEHARTLRPRNSAALINLTAALAAEGQGQRAATELETALEQDPMWTAGHERFAQLMGTLGRGAEATSSLESAIARLPAEAALWESLLYVQLRRGAYDSLAEIVARARPVGVESAEFPIYDAIHAAESADEAFPTSLFESAPGDAGPSLASWRVRHLLRVGEVEAALPILDEGLREQPNPELWALATTAWRLAGDERSQWLENPALVAVEDVSDSLPPRDALAGVLRNLHGSAGEYLDQSVRGGTQTSGSLFNHVDPTIRAVRSAVVDAVRRYVDALPPLDPRHPLLREQRDRRVRFSGSWSVRLGSGGRHTNHIHPLGWISSALYISLPEIAKDETEGAGWLTLGEPDDRLGLGVGPSRTIEPMVGQLALFPSWMWHGTRPFGQGERLTIAFDVMRPY
jgi:tetratricopeptide (TPR) repeat protein